MRGPRPGVHRVLTAGACWLAAALSVLAQAGPAAPAGGERLYRRGFGTSGEPVLAFVQGDLRIRATDMPCVNCHRRSGWGTSEGPLTVPPIAGPALFAPVTRGAAEMTAVRTSGAGTRPAYTEESLLRALRDGVDPNGRLLSATMPRYAVTAPDVSALAAFLRSLSAAPPPGLTESTIHLATIVGDDVDPGRRASVLDVLRAFVRMKNAGTRHEARRRERGPWDMKQHYQNYREWVLHEWSLHGDPTGWPAQLEAHLRRQPVFALVSGTIAGDWTPIHEFSVRHGIPVVFPQAPVTPAAPEDPFYALYFTRGVALEAQALAKHFASDAPSRQVVQVARCGSAGSQAAEMLAREAPVALRITTACLEPGAAWTAGVWRRFVAAGTNAIVAWLDAADRSAFDTLPALDTAAEIYVSSNLLGDSAQHLPDALAARISIVNTFVAPTELERHAWRAFTWFGANALNPADRFAAVDAFFAAAAVSDALSMPGTLTSREYFLERIEHMAGRSPVRSAHPGLTFSATHRVGSSAVQIVKVSS